jgi:hypothetical protein
MAMDNVFFFLVLQKKKKKLFAMCFFFNPTDPGLEPGRVEKKTRKEKT